jgi:hypothetical protein
VEKSANHHSTACYADKEAKSMNSRFRLPEKFLGWFSIIMVVVTVIMLTQ